MNTIDFTRGDLGLWLFFILIPLLLFRFILKPFNGDQPARGRLPAVFRRLLAACAIALALVGFLMAWQRLPPQYFVKMRLDPEGLELGFRWPEPDARIPYGEIRSVQIVRSGT